MLSILVQAALRGLLVSAALALCGLSAHANDLKVRIDGPISDGTVEFGFHDDFLLVEGCGGTCFAPPVCQVFVPSSSADSPIDIADRLALAIATDPLCMAMGFSAVPSSTPGGSGLVTISWPSSVVYNCCVDFQHLHGRRGCCPASASTTGGRSCASRASTARRRSTAWGASR